LANFALSPACLLASFGVLWFSHTIADPDLWGHVRFGQDIVRTGRIIQTDIYSYRTAGQPWINHEWLSEVIFASLYDHGGPAALIVFKVLVSLAIVGWGYAYFRHWGLGPLWSVLLLVLVSVPFRLGLGTIRPQIFTYLCFLVELLVLEQAAKRRVIWLWGLPVVFAVWVNLHGGVLAGVGVLGLWLVGHVVETLRVEDNPPIRNVAAVVRTLFPVIASCLALLLNPYGVVLVRFLFRTATIPRPEITEWAPLGLMSLAGLLYLVLLAIGIVSLVFSRRHRTPDGVLVFAISAALPMISNRHYPLFALALVVLVGEHVADVWNRATPRALTRLGQSVWFGTATLALSLVLLGASVRQFGCIRIEPFYFTFPARVVELIKQSGARGNMAVPFDWGEYVIWHLGPAMKVSIDGRRETVYSDASYQQSLAFARGTGVWDSLLKNAPTDLVLIPNGSPTANLLSRTDGWLALYQDSCCLLFIREGFPNLERIVSQHVPALPDDGDGLCFPAPG
jgi:hypothetical protein